MIRASSRTQPQSSPPPPPAVSILQVITDGSDIVQIVLDGPVTLLLSSASLTIDNGLGTNTGLINGQLGPTILQWADDGGGNHAPGEHYQFGGDGPPDFDVTVNARQGTTD